MSTQASRYHHGALRQALLDAAAIMLQDGGPQAVNLREAARRAGVSSAAVFRHFPNREALLVTLGARGFELLAEDLRKAASNSEFPAEAMGVAYIGFALRHPGRFRVMFSSGLLNREEYAELREAAAAAFGLLKEAMETGAARDADQTLMRWARVHGLAHLALDGLLADTSPERIFKLLRLSG